jgi:RNA polymerase sigma factor (sigma-70 family)
LVTQSGLGVSEAFAVLVRRHSGPLRTHLRRMGAQGSDADDMAQEAFLIAFERLSEYRGDGPFMAWLKMIAARRYLKKIKATQKYLFVEDMQPFFDDDIPQIIPERAINIDEALQHLKPIERLCVTLNFSGELTHANIALETGLPLGTVKSHIKRALHQLKLSLTEIDPKIKTAEKRDR